LKNYGEFWADDILPVAREAHERLQFINVHETEDQGKTVMAGDAREKKYARPRRLFGLDEKSCGRRVAQGWLAPCRSAEPGRWVDIDERDGADCVTGTDHRAAGKS